jgi:hypothetical protein
MGQVQKVSRSGSAAMSSASWNLGSSIGSSMQRGMAGFSLSVLGRRISR